MAKLGDFEFPEVGLTDSVELARRIHEDLGGEVRRDGLAMILDMSPTGGAYGARIGALRLWGLATGRSVIKLTEDAEIVVSTTFDEEFAIMRKLAQSVPLFNEVHERAGSGALDQRVLAVMLHEITGAEMGEVKRRVAMVERIFKAIRGFIDINAQTDASEYQIRNPESENLRNNTFSTQQLSQGWIEFKYDDGNLRLRETPENLDVLMNVLEARKLKFRRNQ